MHWCTSSQGNVQYTRWLLKVGKMVYSATCTESGFTQTVTTFQRTSRVNEQKKKIFNILIILLYIIHAQ